MGLNYIDHVNIDTNRLADTLDFYCGALGLEQRPKPSGNPGAWLYLADRAVIHLNVIEAEGTNWPTGAFNHVAFSASDFGSLQDRLVTGGYDYTVSDRPDIGLKQVSVIDPNGVAVELNFDLAE